MKNSIVLKKNCCCNETQNKMENFATKQKIEIKSCAFGVYLNKNGAQGILHIVFYDGKVDVRNAGYFNLIKDEMGNVAIAFFAKRGFLLHQICDHIQ